jgi:hypothetical protein
MRQSGSERRLLREEPSLPMPRTTPCKRCSRRLWRCIHETKERSNLPEIAEPGPVPSQGRGTGLRTAGEGLRAGDMRAGEERRPIELAKWRTSGMGTASVRGRRWHRDDAPPLSGCQSDQRRDPHSDRVGATTKRRRTIYGTSRRITDLRYGEFRSQTPDSLRHPGSIATPPTMITGGISLVLVPARS